MNEEQSQTEVLPAVALRGMVMFPTVMSGLRIGRPRSVAALERAMEGDRRLLLVAQRRAETDEPDPEDLHEIGTLAEIEAIGEAEDGVRAVTVTGLERRRITGYDQLSPWLAARSEPLPDAEEEPPADLEAQVMDLYASGKDEFERRLLVESLRGSVDLSFFVAAQTELSVEEKQKLLAEPSPANRLRTLVPALKMAQRIEAVGHQFWQESQGEVTGEDRERYLRQQEERVKDQLRELGAEPDEVEELRRQVDEADLPDEARAEAELELDRMSRMQPGLPGYGICQDFIDWLVNLPWHQSTEAVVDLHRARQVLDRDHYDRREVKERILEYLSVRQLNPRQQGALLCFVGAPGVGKTSMGRSIAEATGRKFHRVSLGGIRDEAEVRGHRRTYIAALPGRIIRALRTVGVNNPVVMLDEIDKIRGGALGSPASALLEVLDPAENKEFVDNYISVPFDLSSVMFIGTANTVDTIPGPLLDRLEVIELPGYSTDEKIAIADRYLVPKQLEANGLGDQPIEFDAEALELLVESYTREAGVRNLEREIAAICRKLAREQMGGTACYRHIDRGRVSDLAGPPRYHPERAHKLGSPGVCPTLAVSAAGAGLLVVEVVRVEGRGKLIVTGRVGEVLEESASLAFSFWKSRAEQFGLDETVFADSDFHVHFPHGQRPKEGTSAGLPMVLALASSLTHRSLPDDVAGVGEITLHGRVLPVERVVERLAAAQRAEIRHVVLPLRNRPEVEGSVDLHLPPDMKLSYVSTVHDALDTVLPGFETARPLPG